MTFAQNALVAYGAHIPGAEMPAQERETITMIAQQVREYLSTHPRAADTLDGITGWWLPRQGASANPELVQQALDYLVTRNEVVRVRSADGHVLYARGKP